VGVGVLLNPLEIRFNSAEAPWIRLIHFVFPNQKQSCGLRRRGLI